MGKKAVVLLSTYNGEKYLDKLLDSIINQTYKDVDIYIRDDKSSDNTIKILKDYSSKYKNIIIEFGKNNLGYPECFYALTNNAPKAEYYFFADQDDIWFPDKIEKAINIVKKSKEKIFAYYSGYNICNEKLEITGRSTNKKNNISFYQTIYEVCGLEFTMCITKEALALLNKNTPKVSKARGTWMSMLFSSTGVVYYDNNPYALYRRHINSVTSSKMKGLGLWIWRYKKFITNNEFSSYKTMLLDFKEVYYSKLNDDNKKIIDLFTSSNKIKKIIYPKRLRSRLLDEIALRFMFLIGKL